MSTEAQLLKKIYEELKAIRNEIANLNKKIESLIIPEEEISEEEAKELDRLAKETREKGIDWDELKEELGL